MKLLVIGYGQYSQVVKDIADKQYNLISYLDDSNNLALDKLENYKKYKNDYDDVIVSVGNSNFRMKWIDLLIKEGFNVISLVSNKAFVSESAKIGKGAIIEPFSVINANTIIENGVIISAGAIVNHDSLIENGVHLDCGVVVKSNTKVEKGIKVECGVVI